MTFKYDVNEFKISRVNAYRNFVLLINPVKCTTPKSLYFLVC